MCLQPDARQQMQSLTIVIKLSRCVRTHSPVDVSLGFVGNVLTMFRVAAAWTAAWSTTRHAKCCGRSLCTQPYVVPAADMEHGTPVSEYCGLLNRQRSSLCVAAGARQPVNIAKYKPSCTYPLVDVRICAVAMKRWPVACSGRLDQTLAAMQLHRRTGIR